MEGVRAIVLISALASLSVLSILTADATPSWSTLLSTTLAVGNGSAAIVSSSVLVSPDGKSWNFGVQIGTSTLLQSDSEAETPCTFGIFKLVGTATTWKWVAVNSTDIAFATVSFSAGSELQLLVDWRNGTNDSVAWSSGTGQDAQAAALSNDGQILLLDSQNITLWQRPGGPLQTNGSFTPCPANLCLPPSPPPSPPPPAAPSGSHPSPPSGSNSLYPSLAFTLVLSLIYNELS